MLKYRYYMIFPAIFISSIFNLYDINLPSNELLIHIWVEFCREFAVLHKVSDTFIMFVFRRKSFPFFIG